jgi:hypothetical protein
MPRTRSYFSIALLLLGITAGREALGQCILANPSFEMLGSGSETFAGWSQFGPTGSSSSAAHGKWAARVSGPNLGGWDVAGYWQQMDSAPSARWSASVYVKHPAARPLTGQSKAILNIEWRDVAGGLIGYESFALADAATPTDVFRKVAVTSQPAPAGTAKARLLLGVLQAPTDAVPDVVFDQATFDDLTPPTLADIQWSDFPGGRKLAFGGRTWRVKGPGYYGPGPSLFRDTAECVWVDADDRMHLTVKRIGSSWYSTEVALEDVLGYGDYIFTTRGRLDTLHPNVVFGLYIWQYGPCYDSAYLWWNPYNEFDIEFSRWNNPANPIGQFVAQPYDYPGNISRFDATFAENEITSHAFRWLPGRVECRSWRGGPLDEATSVRIYSWNYTGPHIPRPEQPRVHLNLWQVNGPPSSNQEVVIDQFLFVPACGDPLCVVDVPATVPAAPATRLAAARPNPFAGRTAIRYVLAAGGEARLEVYDVAGRRVRTLVAGVRPAGTHEVEWDGRDDAGRRVAAGVYRCRLRAEGTAESRPVIVLQ